MTYEVEEDAKKAEKKLHKSTFMECEIRVEFAKGNRRTADDYTNGKGGCCFLFEMRHLLLLICCSCTVACLIKLMLEQGAGVV